MILEFKIKLNAKMAVSNVQVYENGKFVCEKNGVDFPAEYAKRYGSMDSKKLCAWLQKAFGAKKAN